MQRERPKQNDTMEENIKKEDVLLESTTNQIEKIQATVNKIDLDLISKYQTIAPKSENLKARLCEDCYENKRNVEWDSRCGGEFHKL